MREKGSCALAQRANSMNSDKGGAPHTPKPQVDTALLVTCFLTRRNSLVKLGLHEFVEEPGLQPQGHCLGSALARGACRLRATCEIHANDRNRFSALSPPPPPPPCRRALVKSATGTKQESQGQPGQLFWKGRPWRSRPWCFIFKYKLKQQLTKPCAKKRS